MSRSISFGLVAALLLGLAIGASPAVAQKTTRARTAKAGAKAPAAGGHVGNAQTGPPAAPQPKSPVASAPQVLLPAAASGLDSAAGWMADLGAAQARARATGRPLLAVFSGSDWCQPCVVYEQEVFAKPEFAAYAKDKLVLAHFDFPRLKQNQPSAAQLKLNAAAAAQLNREGDYPLAVVLSPEGQVLAKTGYIAGGPAAFAAYLKTVLPAL